MSFVQAVLYVGGLVGSALAVVLAILGILLLGSQKIGMIPAVFCAFVLFVLYIAIMIWLAEK